MAGDSPTSADGIAYREVTPAGWDETAPTALFVHGYPTSSYLWRNVLPAVAATGCRAIAPDLPGFGDSPPVLPGTWEQQVENLDRFRRALGLERVILGVHDWGGLIGLRWACDNPSAVAALVITDTGFFPDGRWHGMAKTLRTEGEGEALMENVNRELFDGFMRQVSPGLTDDAIDEFWKAYSDADRRRGHLDMYRSGDFSKLERYRGKLTGLGVPATIIWGAKDEFAPIGGAYRFAKELSGTEPVVLEDAGHFLMEDEPDRVAREIAAFVGSVPTQEQPA